MIIINHYNKCHFTDINGKLIICEVRIGQSKNDIHNTLSLWFTSAPLE